MQDRNCEGGAASLQLQGPGGGLQGSTIAGPGTLRLPCSPLSPPVFRVRHRAEDLAGSRCSRNKAEMAVFQCTGNQIGDWAL